MTNGDIQYEEDLPFPLITVVMVVMFLIALLMLILFVVQLVVGPIGNTPAPDWFYLVMFIFMLAVAFLVANFRVLVVRITSQSVTVSYGMIKRVIPWGDIETAFRDESPGLRYGGWGSRITRIEGRWRLAYNVIGTPGVVLRLRKGRVREFMFSTKNPEQVLDIIHRQIGAGD